MTEATALVTTTSVGRQTDRPVFSGGTREGQGGTAGMLK